MSLDQHIRASIDAALDDLRTRVEADMRSIIDKLVTAAAEEREEALTAARQEALDEAAKQTAREVADAEARVQASLDRAVADGREQERTLAEQKLSDAVAATETRLQQAVAEASASAAQQLAEAREQSTAAVAEAESRAAQALTGAVSAARAEERESNVTAGARLLESVRGLDGATTLSEVLDALGRATSREASRAAVIVVRNDRLLGWKLSGFGALDSQPKNVDLGLNDGASLALAVAAARPVTTREGQGVGGPPFAELSADQVGVAVPVIVGGRVVAVAYADNGVAEGREHTVRGGWAETIEVLVRHAARCLEALTVQRVGGSASPRFWVPSQGAPAAKGHAGAASGPGLST
jgi:hypothetical protein